MMLQLALDSIAAVRGKQDTTGDNEMSFLTPT